MNSAPTAAATASAARASFFSTFTPSGVRGSARRTSAATTLMAGHCCWLDAARREGHVVEVLDEHRVDAALDQGAGIRERRSHDARHRPVPPRAAGQGREVDHADDRALELHQR